MTPKRTPFYDVGVAAGADMRDLFGYWLPWEYAPGYVEEHLATRNKVSVCDLDYMAEFRITGPQAADFLSYLVTNAVSDLAVGQVRYTAIVDESGKMIDDGTVWRLGEEEFVLITGAEEDYKWVQEVSSRFDVQVSNETSEWTTLAVQGPNALALTSAVASGVDVEALRYYRFERTELLGTDCIVARMGYTGERGYEFHLASSVGAELWKALFAAGQELGVLPCGQAALESLRQEAGYLLVGNDHDPSVTPFEAGIGRVVRFDKGDFHGRDGLAAVREEGVKQLMVWMKGAGSEVAETGDPISVGSREIGRVTSGSYSPTQGRGVAMGYVDPRFAIAGANVEIRSGNGAVTASLSTMPLYDPGDVKTRAR